MGSQGYRAGNDLTGFILAGGASRRMGRDKAQIPWGESTLLTHSIQQIKQVAQPVFVVGRVAENLTVPVIADKLSSGDSAWRSASSGRGPLAGIHAALSHSTTEWNLILALDLPLVTSRLLAWIADFREQSSYPVVVPRVKSHFQPLCAAYHRDLLQKIDEALARCQSSIHRLLERLGTRIIEEEELIANGFSPEMFLNVNTPEDLERARAIANTVHG